MSSPDEEGTPQQQQQQLDASSSSTDSMWSRSSAGSSPYSSSSGDDEAPLQQRIVPNVNDLPEGSAVRLRGFRLLGGLEVAVNSDGEQAQQLPDRALTFRASVDAHNPNPSENNREASNTCPLVQDGAAWQTVDELSLGLPPGDHRRSNLNLVVSSAADDASSIAHCKVPLARAPWVADEWITLRSTFDRRLAVAARLPAQFVLEARAVGFGTVVVGAAADGVVIQQEEEGYATAEKDATAEVEMHNDDNEGRTRSVSPRRQLHNERSAQRRQRHTEESTVFARRALRLLRRVVVTTGELSRQEADERRRIALAFELQDPRLTATGGTGQERFVPLDPHRAGRHRLEGLEWDVRAELVHSEFTSYNTLIRTELADRAQVQQSRAYDSRSRLRTLERKATLGVLDLVAMHEVAWRALCKKEAVARASVASLRAGRQEVEDDEKIARIAITEYGTTTLRALLRAGYAEREPLQPRQVAYATAVRRLRAERLRADAAREERMKQFEERTSVEDDETRARRTVERVSHAAYQDILKLYDAVSGRMARSRLTVRSGGPPSMGKQASFSV